MNKQSEDAADILQFGRGCPYGLWVSGDPESWWEITSDSRYDVGVWAKGWGNGDNGKCADRR